MSAALRAAGSFLPSPLEEASRLQRVDTKYYGEDDLKALRPQTQGLLSMGKPALPTSNRWWFCGVGCSVFRVSPWPGISAQSSGGKALVFSVSPKFSD